MRRTVHNHVLVKESLAVATRTANANGTGVDLRQGRMVFRSASVVVHTGTISDGTHTFEVQESDDNSTYTAVADSDLLGTEPAVGAADDNEIHEIGYVGTKRFVRATVAVSGSPLTGGTYGAVVLLGDPSIAPVTR